MTRSSLVRALAPSGRRLGSLAALVACAFAVATSPLAARADEASDLETARELFREASRLSEQGKWAEARDRYERSLALKRSPITLYSLGAAQRQTGQLARALESFRAFLREPPTPATRPYETEAREAVADLEKRVATVVVAVAPGSPPGLVVRVDGAAATPGGAGVPADPGVHVVTASAPGHLPARAEITTREGERTTVALALAPDRSGATPAAGPPLAPLAPRRAEAPSSSPAAPSTRGYVAWGLVGGGAALFAGGIVVGLLGVQTASQAKTREDDVASAARTQAATGDVLVGVGLCAAAAGVVLLITDTPSRTGAGVARR